MMNIGQNAHHAAGIEQESKPSVEAHCEVDSWVSSASQLLSNLAILAWVEQNRLSLNNCHPDLNGQQRIQMC